MKTGMLRISVMFAVAFTLVCVNSAGAGDEVVITHPGVVFHMAGSHDFHGHAVGKSMEAAMAAGYVPCPVCFGKAASASGSVAKPGAGATAASAVATAGLVIGPTTQPKAEYRESRGGSRVMATGCLSHDAVCPYGVPFRTIPGL